MSLLEKIILDKNLSVLSKISDGRLLPLITVEFLAKSELNNPGVFVKSVTNLFSQSKGGIIGVFIIQKYFDRYAPKAIC